MLLKLLAYSFSLLVATLFHWKVSSKVKRKLTYNVHKFNIIECFEIKNNELISTEKLKTFINYYSIYPKNKDNNENYQFIIKIQNNSY